MGAGNFSLANAETVYIDNHHVYWDDCEQELDLYLVNESYEELVANLRQQLPDSFSDVENECYEGSSVIAENNFYKIVLTGWVGYFAVSVLLKDDDDRYDWGINPLAAHHHAGVSQKFFDKVNDIYPLRVPTSAWTSGPYVSQAA